MYLGDAVQLKTLLPHPKAAIMISDFANLSEVANYLNYLISNETAYEEHRSWRKTYSLESHVKDKPLLQNTWFCRICQWAANEGAAIKAARNSPGNNSSSNHHHKDKKHGSKTTTTSNSYKPKHCQDFKDESTSSQVEVKTMGEFENKIVRSSSRIVYLVKSGELHAVPSLATLKNLGLKATDVAHISDDDLSKWKIGEPIARVDNEPM